MLQRPAQDPGIAIGDEIIALVKPQFEVGKEEVEKKGIIKDKGKHKRVLFRIADLARRLGWKIKGMAASPILGWPFMRTRTHLST